MPRNINCLLFAFALVCLVAGNHSVAAQAPTTSQQEQNEPLPKGKWRVTTLFDNKQYADPSVPVELTRVTLSSEENNKGLVELIIKNRTSKNILSLKIRYYLVSDNQDNPASDSQENVL